MAASNLKDTQGLRRSEVGEVQRVVLLRDMFKQHHGPPPKKRPKPAEHGSDYHLTGCRQVPREVYDFLPKFRVLELALRPTQNNQHDPKNKPQEFVLQVPTLRPPEYHRISTREDIRHGY